MEPASLSDAPVTTTPQTLRDGGIPVAIPESGLGVELRGTDTIVLGPSVGARDEAEPEQRDHHPPEHASELAHAQNASPTDT